MLAYLFDTQILDVPFDSDDIDGTVCAAESNGALPFALALQRLIVKARNPPHFFEPLVLNALDPGLKLDGYVSWDRP
ncbi:MAG: hypothetical protein ACE5JI_08585 [Acidobacteriota bacterium]